MSTTLHDHPPQPHVADRLAEPEAPRLTSRRPTALDRLALRVGLLLITYGRRPRYILSREELARRRRNAADRQTRELQWQLARLRLPQR